MIPRIASHTAFVEMRIRGSLQEQSKIRQLKRVVLVRSRPLTCSVKWISRDRLRLTRN